MKDESTEEPKKGEKELKEGETKAASSTSKEAATNTGGPGMPHPGAPGT